MNKINEIRRTSNPQPNLQGRIRIISKLLVKSIHNWEKTLKCVTFQIFFYLCHVLLKVFLCLIFRSTKISEIFDMTNTWVTFCCPSYSKKYFITMLRILGI